MCQSVLPQAADRWKLKQWVGGEAVDLGTALDRGQSQRTQSQLKVREGAGTAPHPALRARHKPLGWGSYRLRTGPAAKGIESKGGRRKTRSLSWPQAMQAEVSGGNKGLWGWLWSGKALENAVCIRPRTSSSTPPKLPEHLQPEAFLAERQERGEVGNSGPEPCHSSTRLSPGPFCTSDLGHM